MKKNWFKMLWLSSEERAILRAGLEKKPEPVELVSPRKEDQIQVSDSGISVPDKPYKNIYYSNGNLTVVLKDGTMLGKAGDAVLVYAVKNATSQQEIENLMIDRIVEPQPVHSKQEYETVQERELVSDNLDVFYDNPEFEVKGKEVFLKGVNLAMPASVIASFIEILEQQQGIMEFGIRDNNLPELFDQLQALKMFWLKLALNTIPQSREDMLTFVCKNDVRITKNGNVVLYRRIVSKTGADQNFVTFVSQQYYRLKKQNQNTRDFAVAKVGDDYGLIDLRDYNGETGPEPFMNLQVAYMELPTYETNTFTAWHDKKVEIKIGGIYKIPDTGINLNNGICAAGGLHAACVTYDYSGFGDLPVVVLVNPSKAITVPVNETGKLRTTEMFIACVNDKPHGIHFDDSALGAFDEEYHDLSLSELEEAARTKSFEKLAVADTVPAISLVDLNVIKNMLKNRIKAI